MATKNNNTSRRTDSFSLAKMRDTFTDVTDKLVKEIRRQNPDINADNFETDLRTLVLRYGNGITIGNSDYFTGASVEVTPPSIPQHEHCLAADVIAAAYFFYEDGKTKEAVSLMASALETQGMAELANALYEANSNTQLAVEAALSAELLSNIEDPSDELSEEEVIDSPTTANLDSDSDSDSDSEDSEEPVDSEDSNEDVPVDDSDDFDESDESDESDDSDDSDDSELSSESESDADADEGTESEPTEESTSEEGSDLDEVVADVFSSVKSKVNGKMSREERTLLNKISLSGSKQFRNLARTYE